MAKGCKKCDPHEICEECPEWIFTLADLIMCMMGLFVILWVLKPGMTTPPAAAGADVKQATDEFNIDMTEFRSGFSGTPLDVNSTDPMVQAAIRRRRGKLEGGEAPIKRDSPTGTDELNTTIRPGKQAVVGGRILFDAGATKFTQETIRNLDEIAKLIRGHRNIVLVKGHTALDDLPEDASAEERMALSLQRAKAIADYLTSKGVEPEILRVQGCSTFEPVRQRAYSPNALQLNRRVEVISTANLVEEMQDRSAAPALLKPNGESAKPAESHDAAPATEHAAPAHAAPSHGH